MAYSTPVTAVSGTAYSAANMNIIVDDIIYLYAQRPLSGYIYSGTDWSPSAADGTYEDDTDSSCEVEITVPATSTIIAVGMARITSGTARTQAVKMRFKLGSSTYSSELGYAGIPAADYRIAYPLLGVWTGCTAATYTIVLQAAQYEADDSLTIEDRMFGVLVIPE